MKKSMGAKAAGVTAPVYIVGTYGDEGEATAMNVAWGGICSSEPPCIMISIRKNRYTYKNIMRNRAFSVNIPDIEHVQEADYFGLVSGKTERKFDVTGLHTEKGNKANAPVIKEFPVSLECKYINNMETDSHVIIIGEILDVLVEEACIVNNAIDIEKVNPLIYDIAGNKYNKVGKAINKAFSAGLPYLR